MPPIFRLGEPIENAVSKGYKARYIHAPKDPVKWARICEHIIRHYTEGWANGFTLDIYAVAATDGTQKAVLIANIGKDITLDTNLEDFDVYLIDEDHDIKKINANSTAFTIKENQVIHLKK